jgi:type II secretory pathway component GspD/PulD (secretin)
MRSSTRALLLFLFLLPFQLFAEETILTRAFTIKFRKVEDAAMIVNRLLSEHGAVTIQPHIKTIVVQDYEANLKKIEGSLASYDTPAPSIDLSIKLVLAKKVDGAVQPEQEDIGNVGKILRYNQYSVLDHGSVSSQEGRSSAVNLGEQYQLTFVTDSIQQDSGIIRLKNFELRKIRKGKGGKDPAPPLLSMTLNLRNAEQLVLGASRFEDSDQALLVILVGTVKK